MKVLTLHQPWASLVALGVKTIETRSWSTKYRGPLAIHAAARKPAVEMLEDGPAGDEEWGQWFETGADAWKVPPPPEMRWSIALAPAYDVVTMPLGAIVATCTLVDVVPMVAELGCSEVLGKGPLVTVSRAGDHVTGLTWKNTVSPTRYIDKEFCERLRADRTYGLYEPGRYAWLLADIVPVDPAVPFKGGQGLTRTWEPVSA